MSPFRPAYPFLWNEKKNDAKKRPSHQSRVVDYRLIVEMRSKWLVCLERRGRNPLVDNRLFQQLWSKLLCHSSFFFFFFTTLCPRGCVPLSLYSTLEWEFRVDGSDQRVNSHTNTHGNAFKKSRKYFLCPLLNSLEGFLFSFLRTENLCVHGAS